MTILIKGEPIENHQKDSPCKLIMGSKLFRGERIKGECYIFDENDNIFSKPEYIPWHSSLKFLYKGVMYVDGNGIELFRDVATGFLGFKSKIVFEGKDYAISSTADSYPSLGINIVFDRYNFETTVLKEEFWKIGLVLSYNAYFSQRFRP